MKKVKVLVLAGLLALLGVSAFTGTAVVTSASNVQPQSEHPVAGNDHGNGGG